MQVKIEKKFALSYAKVYLNYLLVLMLPITVNKFYQGKNLMKFW